MGIDFKLFLAVALPVWIIFRRYNAKCRKAEGLQSSFRHELIANLLFAYLLYLAQMTVFPLSTGIIFKRQYNFVPFKTITMFIPGLLEHGLVNDMHDTNLTASAINIIGNIVVFIPVGLIVPLMGDKYKKFRNTFLIGFGISLVIEITQLFFVEGRCMDVDDLILNTMGAAAGWVLYYVIKCLNRKFFKASIC